MGSHPELSMPQQPEKESKEEPPPPGEPATLWRTVRDEPRSITSLVAAPRWGLVALHQQSVGTSFRLADPPHALLL